MLNILLENPMCFDEYFREIENKGFYTRWVE